MTATWQILPGDCIASLRSLPDCSVQTCITSPPYYGLRDYGHDQQIGLEESPAEYVTRLVEVFREVRRVLRGDGTLWLNLGDTYASGGMSNPSPGSTLGGGKERGAADYTISRTAPAGCKPKDLLGIPWMVAFALRDDGWYLRSEIIWAKPNPMPESVTDRPTKAHEQVFLLAKSPRYFYDAAAIREDFADDRMGNPGGGGAYTLGSGRNDSGVLASGVWEKGAEVGGRNKRTVWTVATQPFSGAHFAVFPPKLIEPMVLAGSSDKACAKCGRAWERVVERTPMVVRPSERVQTRDQDEARTATSGTMVEPPTSRTVGFKPACACNAGTTPSVVLDPFAGSGTTGMVALRHGRSFIGCELNPEYVEIARRRIVDDAPLLNQLAEAA